jgi:hypothetical protein|tara:strand:- start:45 stop:509 length:465 start_codon:yes stop_codon:yes gene_type:complete
MTINCALVNTTSGEITSIVYSPTPEEYVEGHILPDGRQAKWTDEDITCSGHYYNYDTSAFGAKGSKPSRFHEWDWDHRNWANHLPNLFAAIRQHRNMLLSTCDWTMMSDVSLTDTETERWLLYRDQLRHFPAWNSGETDWDSLVWPTPPPEWLE